MHIINVYKVYHVYNVKLLYISIYTPFSHTHSYTLSILAALGMRLTLTTRSMAASPLIIYITTYVINTFTYPYITV